MTARPPPPDWVWHVTQLWPPHRSHNPDTHGAVVASVETLTLLFPSCSSNRQLALQHVVQKCFLMHEQTRHKNKLMWEDLSRLHKFPHKILSESEFRTSARKPRQQGTRVAWLCTVSTSVLLTGRRRDRPSHAATEIRLGEAICLLWRESEKKKKQRLKRPDWAGRLQRGRSSCRLTSVIFLHFILVLPSPCLGRAKC